MQFQRISLDQARIISITKLLFLSVIAGCLLLGYFFDNGKSNTDNGKLVYVLLDVSQSMLVQDSYQGTSRLDTAKTMLKEIVANTSTQRGVSVFAGETRIISPITQDSNTFLTLIGGVNSESLMKQGSNIEDALRQTIARFGSGSEEKFLLFLSDGGEETITLSQEFLQTYKNHHIHIIVGGLGSEQGGPIILGSDIRGKPSYRIFEGKPVVAKLNQSSLQSLASQLNGDYIHFQNSSDAKRISKKIGAGGQQRNRWWFSAWLLMIVFLLTEYGVKVGEKIKQTKIV